MKNLYTAAIATILTLGSFLSFTSCEKEDPPPEIFFKTAQGFTSADALIAKKTEVKMGINAAKSGDNDFLTKFTITRSRNNGEDLIVFTQNLTGVDRDEFSYDYIITTADTSSLDVYTFTVKTDDGLANQVSLTLDVK